MNLASFCLLVMVKLKNFPVTPYASCMRGGFLSERNLWSCVKGRLTQRLLDPGYEWSLIIQGFDNTYTFTFALFVIPAKAGIQKPLKRLDSRFRGNEG